MTATVIQLRPDTATTAPVETRPRWWGHCPDWCESCTGGETLTYPDGLVYVSDRVHVGILARAGQVTVEQVRYQDPDGHVDTVELRVNGSTAALDPTQRTAIAVALLGIDNVAAHSRPPVATPGDGRVPIPTSESGTR